MEALGGVLGEEDFAREADSLSDQTEQDDEEAGSSEQGKHLFPRAATVFWDLHEFLLASPVGVVGISRG